jgi:hypothetical protein
MIFRIVDKEKGILAPLKHIPPELENEFWEKNKHTGLYIKANIVTAYPECVKYDHITNRVYNDLNCVHQKRIERKVKEFNEATKQAIEKYLIDMDWGTSYTECITDLTSTLQFLERNKDKYPEYYNFVKELHDTIEEIWLDESKIEEEIKKTKSYAELQKYDSYRFINTKVKPRLEKMLQIYLRCKSNQNC